MAQVAMPPILYTLNTLNTVQDSQSNLLPSDAHAGVDIGKDRWLNEVSFVSNALSTTQQLRTLRLARLYQLQNLLHLNVVDLRETDKSLISVF